MSRSLNWERVAELIGRALELPTSERSAWLERECSNDPELRSEVASLLAVAGDSPGYLSRLADQLVGPAIHRILSGDIGAADAWVGRTIGPYTILERVGRGGMATVYLADDAKHHRKVAVKVLRPELAAVIGPDRFLREIDIAARLTHPQILPLHDSGEAYGSLYYVMPYVQGESLRGRLTREAALSVADVERILREIADALSYAHAQGVVHRDIKPENVLLTGRHALVTDFGVAKAVSAAAQHDVVTSVGAVVGTPGYMAPEQAAAESGIDHRADIYAFGVVAYEMLAGRPPFLGPTGQHVTPVDVVEDPEPLTHYRSDVPPALADLVMQCLARNPAERWQSAAKLLTELEALTTPTGSALPVARASGGPRRRGRRLALAGSAAAVLLIGAAWATGILRPVRDQTWVRTVAVPEIRRLTEADDVVGAHLLALKAERISPGDTLLAATWSAFAWRVTLTSRPSGAVVSWRPYAGPDSTWRVIGRTPLDSIWFPHTLLRLRLELPGYLPYEVAASFDALEEAGHFTLDRRDSIPEGVVRVPGGSLMVRTTSLNLPGLPLDDFLMDVYEVTNRRYKAFVDAGGYEKPEYWHHRFVLDDRQLTWREAVARFTDATGRPGPSAWELGGYPEGEEEYPVRGVSWYEAAAFAAFERRDLPTIYHWYWAAGSAWASAIVPASNFADQGPAPVGAYRGLNRFGAYDMAGNVREWCQNEATGGTPGRFILGGGWNDAAYQFTDPYTQSPWDRSPTNGFRLVTYLRTDRSLDVAARPIALPYRDFLAERPVGDAEFAVYRRMYAYDRAPLNARFERADTARDWIREKVTFDAAYGNERMTAYLFVPRSAAPPYQPVVYFPGSAAIFLDSIDQDFERAWDFIVKGGRVLMYPVYRGTFERNTELNTDLPSETLLYRDYMIQWSRDLGRSIDYLETRDDIDVRSLGYFGFSWGARLGPLMMAVEPRIRAGVLHVAGLKFQRALPEADPINFATRVKVPVLMLNGRYDQYFPLETSQIPLFRLLGTPAEQKRHVVYDAGHFVPRGQLIRATLDWYDRFLGPTRR